MMVIFGLTVDFSCLAIDSAILLPPVGAPRRSCARLPGPLGRNTIRTGDSLSQPDCAPGALLIPFGGMHVAREGNGRFLRQPGARVVDEPAMHPDQQAQRD